MIHGNVEPGGSVFSVLVVNLDFVIRVNVDARIDLIVDHVVIEVDLVGFHLMEDVVLERLVVEQSDQVMVGVLLVAVRYLFGRIVDLRHLDVSIGAVGRDRIFYGVFML